MVWIRTGGETCRVRLWPKASEPVKTTFPVPSRTTTCAPPPAAVSTTGTGAAAWPPLVRPADPSARLGDDGEAVVGWSITSRATDQASTTVITAATITDQFGPPATAADRAVPAGGELGLEDPARVDRRVGVLVVVGRQQRRHVDAEHPGQGAQVAARVEVAAARREVVDLDRLDDVRADPGPVGELVDREPQPLAGGRQLGADHRVDRLELRRGRR